MSGFDVSSSGMVVLGTIAKPIGLAGACGVRAYGETLRQLKFPVDVYVGDSESDCSLMTIVQVMFKPKGPLCTFTGVDDPDSAEVLRGKQIFIRSEALPSLKEGSFYHFELAGMKVKTDLGDQIGIVESIHNFPSIDSIEIRRPTGDPIMVPLSSDALVEIDRTAGVVTLRRSFIDELL